MTDDDELARARYHALQRLARQQQRPTDELLVLYTLEGFLARLAASHHRDRFVLKGGMLLAAFDTRRPTRDLDVHARQLNNDLATIRDTIAEIATQPHADGLQFDTTTVTAQAIREEEDYSGVRVSLDVQLHTGRMKLKVDVNVGDPIWPEPQQVAVPRLLVDEPVVLSGYPLHMVHAEKLVTAVARGTANTRWRDFADIYLLSRRHDLDGADLQQAIAVVAHHRQARVRPLSGVLVGYAALGQPKWVAWRTRHQLDDRLPESFAEVIDAVTTFADPALRQSTSGRIWRARFRVWQPDDAP